MYRPRQVFTVRAIRAARELSGLPLQLAVSTVPKRLMQEWDGRVKTTLDPRIPALLAAIRRHGGGAGHAEQSGRPRLKRRTVPGTGCPQSAVRGHNSRRPLLRLERPDLYASIVEAPGVDAASLTCGSGKKVVWSCARCRPPGCTHDRTGTVSVAERVISGCPYCVDSRVCPCSSIPRGSSGVGHKERGPNQTMYLPDLIRWCRGDA